MQHGFCGPDSYSGGAYPLHHVCLGQILKKKGKKKNKVLRIKIFSLRESGAGGSQSTVLLKKKKKRRLGADGFFMILMLNH